MFNFCPIKAFNTEDIAMVTNIENDMVFKVCVIQKDNIPCSVVYRKMLRFDTPNLSHFKKNAKLQEKIIQIGKEHFIVVEISMLKSESEAQQLQASLWNEYNKRYEMYNTIPLALQEISNFVDNSIFIQDYEYTTTNSKSNRHSKRVRCITTNTIFVTVKDAADAIGRSSATITQAIRRKIAAGWFKDGTKLYWEYVE